MRIKQLKVLIKNNIVTAALCISLLLHLFLFLVVLFTSFKQPVARVTVARHLADIPLVFLPATPPTFVPPASSQRRKRHGHKGINVQSSGTAKAQAPQGTKKGTIKKKGKAQQKVASVSPAMPAQVIAFQKVSQSVETQPVFTSKKGERETLKKEKSLEKLKKDVQAVGKSPVKEQQVSGSSQVTVLPGDNKKDILPRKKILPSLPVVESSQEVPNTIMVGDLQGQESERNEASYEPMYQLHRGFQAYWHPPLDSEDLHCTYKVFVTKGGGIEKVVLLQSSGVLIFDTAARTALMKITYPRILWGRECVFTF